MRGREEESFLLGPSTSRWEWEKNDFTITWRDVSVYAKLRNQNWWSRNQQPFKKLVSNASGVVKAGSLVVLMGPSGAGKSSLMAALAHRNPREVFVEGDIRVSGEPVGAFMHHLSGFMHQEDLFVGTLSPREHLELMARLKLDRNTSGRDIRAKVDKLITEVGLSGCADTRIGVQEEKKVISGGERKRLAFATEVLTDPPILFCDEPTTGLDSFSAQYLVGLMKGMTSRGKTVLCTVHQPSSELFAMFHQLIFLSEGRVAFMGDTNSALEFFQRHGFECPANYNPAEVMMRALSVGSEAGKGKTARRLCDEFSVSQNSQEIENLILRTEEGRAEMRDYIKAVTTRTKRRNPSWIIKIFWLTYRSFLQVLRDPSVQAVRILQKLGIALMAGLCFYGSVDLSQAGVQSIQGAIFVLVTENTFPPMYGVLSTFQDEFPLLLREYRSGLYPTYLYYTAKIISLIPGLLLEPTLFVIVAYFISGLKRTVYAFFMTTMIAILTANVANACGCFFSSAFDSVSTALAFLVPIDYTLMVTSGLFIKLSSMPMFIAWFQYFSWFMYSNEALTIIQWENVYNISCEYKNPEIPCLDTGAEVLEKFDFSAGHLTKDVVAMSSMIAAFHVFACLFLSWKTSKNS